MVRKLLLPLALPVVLVVGLLVMYLSGGAMTLPKAPTATAPHTVLAGNSNGWDWGNNNQNNNNYQSNCHTNCHYPPNASVITASKSSYTSRGVTYYKITGTLKQNNCPEPCETIKYVIKYGSTTKTYYVTTDNYGKYTISGLSSSNFPVTLSFAGDSHNQWPAANSVTVY